MTPQERREYAEKMFQQEPGMFPEERRQSIVEGIVTLGMTPFEAKLAGGAFSFKVVPDRSRWPEDFDPLRVMWAQSVQADDSKVWMMFENSTQFPAVGNIPFRVVFERGQAVSIQMLAEKRH